MLPPRSRLELLPAPESFVWAAGIEDTVITEPWPATGRALDEYALTGHTRRWAEDFALMARLGVGAARYGIPWHEVNPAPGRWDWELADRRLDRLLALGIEPIVDLVHYGVPSWLAGGFLAPDFPARMAEFAARLAERFRGRVRWYTPLNEPRITAWYCGRLGWWPPARRGWRGFVAVLLGLCRGICATVAALRAVDPEIVDVQVDATDAYSSADPQLAAEVELRAQVGFLALDLVTGQVVPGHALHVWLLRHGATAGDLAWFQEHAVRDPAVVGINLYPLFSNKVLRRSVGGLRLRMPYGDGSLVTRLGEAYWRRYRRPVMITETASAGPVARRAAWLAQSVAAVRGLRERGVPLVGYTWWPLFALVGWAYRQGRRPVEDHLVQMGLWDLAPGPDGLRPVETTLVDDYRTLVAGGSAAVGTLRHEGAHVP